MVSAAVVDIVVFFEVVVVSIMAFGVHGFSTNMLLLQRRTHGQRPYGNRLVVVKDQEASFYDPQLSSLEQQQKPQTSSSSSSSTMWSDFDYTARWYPVMWACDLILNQPTKVRSKTLYSVLLLLVILICIVVSANRDFGS
jgi:hypothetical protein